MWEKPLPTSFQGKECKLTAECLKFLTGSPDDTIVLFEDEKIYVFTSDLVPMYNHTVDANSRPIGVTPDNIIYLVKKEVEELQNESEYIISTRRMTDHHAVAVLKPDGDAWKEWISLCTHQGKHSIAVCGGDGKRVDVFNSQNGE